jgi:hypothetical protein
MKAFATLLLIAGMMAGCSSLTTMSTSSGTRPPSNTSPGSQTTATTTTTTTTASAAPAKSPPNSNASAKAQAAAPAHKSYKTLNIPPGQLPPAGKCRVWIPGTPPGKQPAPTSCEAAMSAAQPGQLVVSRTASNQQVLEVKEKKSVQGKVEIVITNYVID